jgi:DNA-directed RNA polymerase subunit M/transcription elongation factor TFIIS
MSEGSFKVINHLTENKKKYANTIDKVAFITDNIKIVPLDKIDYLNSNVKRSETINKIAHVIKDIEAALQIEAGIFEFTLIYATTKDYLDCMMSAIYNDKVYDLLQNLNPNTMVQNKTLCKAVDEGKIMPQTLAFLKPYELDPEKWDELIKKAALKEEKKKNMSVVDIYTCRKCKANKCTIREAQTRSLDEPMTIWITCTVCFHVMKK